MTLKMTQHGPKWSKSVEKSLKAKRCVRVALKNGLLGAEGVLCSTTLGSESPASRGGDPRPGQEKQNIYHNEDQFEEARINIEYHVK